jgi:polysaccharide export outer membrane protein
MVNRPRCKVIVGLGALLGLATIGCEPGSLYTLPTGPGLTPSRSLIASPPPVQLMKPRAVAEEPGELRQVVAVSTSSPVFRPADTQYAGGVVVASSWRAMPSGNQATAGMSPVEMIPPTVSTGPIIGPELPSSGPIELKGDAAEGEHLTMMPHKMPRAAPAVIGRSMPTGHGGPRGLFARHEAHELQPVSGHEAPHEGNKQALPPYVIEPTDVLLVEFTRADAPRPLRGEFLVGPDGVINLGTYGAVRVGGLTVEQARTAIADALQRGNVKPLREKVLDKEGKPKKDSDGKEVEGPEIPIRNEVIVDVVAYNSKFYYVIGDNGGYGATMVRVPVNGSDTVMDALSRIGGLPNVASKNKIFVARSNLGGHELEIMPVDWCGVVRGRAETNYQLVANDRLFIGADPRVVLYNNIDKTLNPFDRIVRTILLTSTTVNSIKMRQGGGTGNTGANAVPIIPVGGG